MKYPIITLLTDFGTKDHYVASMKGVMLGINPRCMFVDISHQVGHQDIREGAFLLGSTFSFFPRGTVHLSVIDPGVGGPRRPILLVTRNYYFVGPDNGLFTLALEREKVKKAIVLGNEKYFLSPVSSTFHGRDVFSPVAAHLTMGTKPEAFGQKTDTWVELSLNKPEQKAAVLTGEIVHVDAFGNLVSNIRLQDLTDFTRGRHFSIRVGDHTIPGPIRGIKRGYWEGRKGETLALIGSGGLLEVSVRQGDASKKWKVRKGYPVQIMLLSGRAEGPE